MIITMIKCEICEKTHQANLMKRSAEWQQLPPQWYTLFPGDGEDGKHFCSSACLCVYCLGASVQPNMTSEQLRQSIMNNLGKQPIIYNPLPLMVKNSEGEFAVIDGKTYKLWEPDESTPQTKMRRFVLIGGETAEEFECVKWGNGRVTIEPPPIESPHSAGAYTFPGWDEFKDAHSGCGIRWIDREVSGE